MLTPNRFAISPNQLANEAYFSTVVIHELAHSTLALDHLRYASRGFIFVNGRKGRTRDGFSSFLEEPVLACYQYEQLGWPVPEYARPCVRLTPSSPQSLSIVQTGDDGLTLTWEPPRFTDDAPLTGYTVGISTPEIDVYNGPYESYEVDSDALSHTFYGPIAASGEYNLSVYATTKYGASELALTNIDLPPAPPPPGPVTVERVDNTSIPLSWAGLEERKYVNLGYEVRFSSGRTASTRWNSHGNVLLYNLLPGTEYTINVRSCSRDPQWDINVCGSWGEPLTVIDRSGASTPRSGYRDRGQRLVSPYVGTSTWSSGLRDRTSGRSIDYYLHAGLRAELLRRPTRHQILAQDQVLQSGGILRLGESGRKSHSLRRPNR